MGVTKPSQAVYETFNADVWLGMWLGVPQCLQPSGDTSSPCLASTPAPRHPHKEGPVREPGRTPCPEEP